MTALAVLWFAVRWFGAVVIGLMAVVAAGVLLDRLFNGAEYVRQARLKGKRL